MSLRFTTCAGAAVVLSLLYMQMKTTRLAGSLLRTTNYVQSNAARTSSGGNDDTKPAPKKTLRSIVMAGNGTCADSYGKYRDYPVEVQDSVNELLGSYMMREPAVAIVNDRPPEPPQDPCESPYAGRFDGTKPPELYTGFVFSHEIELLEARIYEGLGIVDKIFVGESAYTHRGHKKPRFAAELMSTRFRKFRDLVEVVDLDALCPKYLNRTLEYRNMNPRPQFIWDTLSMSFECLTSGVKNYAEKHGTYQDAIVHFSDMDEMPSRAKLASLKQCKLPDDARYPIPFFTNYNKQAKSCHPPSSYIIPGVIYRPHNMKSQRRVGQPGPQRWGKNIGGIFGGIHMTYFGGSAVEFFKTSNHAEGGQMNHLGWLNSTYNPTVCDCTREDWYRREELLCTDVETVARPWIKASPPRNERPPVYGKDDMLPWVIAQNKDRYPCFFEKTKECVDLFIDIMM